MAKRLPEWAVKDYEEYKILLWRALRAFMASFVSTMGLFLVMAQPSDFNSWEDAKKFLIPVFIGAMSAGIVGLGKSLRDAFPDSKIINKLPI
mgnify:CR=1 FL=1